MNIRVCDPLLPQVAHAFSTTPGVAAGMVTAFAIAYGLLQLAWGPIGDRLGKYWVAALASIATGVFTAAARSPNHELAGHRPFPVGWHGGGHHPAGLCLDW
ncbi:MAG: MFS transporter [Sphingomonadales bacterium]|nr:MFS transporter [Sphingomonadales bacterium]